MGAKSPFHLEKARILPRWCLVAGLGLPVWMGLAGCKNAGGTGTASPISFPFNSSPGPTATGTAAAPAAAGTAGLFTGATAGAAANERDPLLGMSTSASPPRPATAAANPYAPYGSGTQPVPGIPNPSGSASPAALTSGAGNAYPISPNTGAQPATAPPIRMDQTGTSGFAPVPGQPGNLQPTSMNVGGDEYRQLQNEFTRRRVVYQRLEMTSENNWRCLVTVPDPANPQARRNFDVRSTSDIGAMRMALQEMDKQAQPVAGVAPNNVQGSGVVPAGYGAVPLGNPGSGSLTLTPTR